MKTYTIESTQVQNSQKWIVQVVLLIANHVNKTSSWHFKDAIVGYTWFLLHHESGLDVTNWHPVPSSLPYECKHREKSYCALYRMFVLLGMLTQQLCEGYIGVCARTGSVSD